MARFLVKDKLLGVTGALPAAAGSSNTDVLDLGLSSQADTHLPVELLVAAPALNATQLPNTTTATYTVQGSTDAAFSSPITLAGSVIVQTGSAGAAAATYRFALPTDCPRYVRAVVTTADVGNASAGNCVAASMSLDVVF